MIDTRLTRRFGLTHPILSAPIPGIAGGALAAAVSRAGGLGVVGVGDADWTSEQLALTGRERVACGLCPKGLTSESLAQVLSYRPRAILLTEGDPTPFADAIREARVPMICEARSVDEARRAVEAGAEVIIARSPASDASLFTLVPELADFLYQVDHDIILLASGDIQDARGFSAAMLLGADGIVLDRGLSVAEEALASGDIPSIWPKQAVQDILATLSSRAERILTHARRRVVGW